MPMNECKDSEVRDLLPLLASGGQVQSSAAVEGHIAGCDACREELALLKAARHALLRAPVVDAARIAGAVPRYRPASVTDSKVVPIESRRIKAPAWRIAAAALVIVAGGTMLAVRQAGDDPGTTPLVASGDSGGSAVAGSDTSVAEDDSLPPSPAVLASGASGGARAGSGTQAQMTFGGGLDDLTEDDLVALLAALEGSEPLAPVEPEDALPSMSADGEEES